MTGDPGLVRGWRTRSSSWMSREEWMRSLNTQLRINIYMQKLAFFFWGGFFFFFCFVLFRRHNP
jgi:hypothetical protein